MAAAAATRRHLMGASPAVAAATAAPATGWVQVQVQGQGLGQAHRWHSRLSFGA